MKREEVLQKLQEAKDGNFDAALDFIMDVNGKDVNNAKSPIKAKDDEIAKLKDALKSLKSEKEQAEQANMTAEQKLQRQMEELAKEKAALAKDRNRIAAAAKLQEQGITGEQADKILDRVVSDDSKATEDTVAAFLEVFATQKTTVEAATKKAMLNSTPAPSGNAGTQPGITKEKFDALSYSERVKLANEYPEVYAQMTK